MQDRERCGVIPHAIGEGVQRRNVVGASAESSVDDEVALPPYTDLLWPTLQAVIALGGSGVIEEIDAEVIDRAGLPDAVRTVLHGDGPPAPRSNTGSRGPGPISRAWACCRTPAAACGA